MRRDRDVGIWGLFPLSMGSFGPGCGPVSLLQTVTTERENVFRRGRSIGTSAALVLLALVLSGCGSTESDAAEGVTSVPIDPDATEFVVNIGLGEDGFEPSTVFVPAGRQIRIVLRNRGTGEYHYRVKGLAPAQMAWMVAPEVDLSYVDAMTPEELAALGLEGDISDMEHELHHLTPVFVPFREESRSGIKPLPTEVHGYVEQGVTDTLTFIATETGAYEVEDVLHPDNTGRLIVFDPR